MCNALLLSPEVPHPAKTFAAQTFRTKVSGSNTAFRYHERLDHPDRLGDLRSPSSGPGRLAPPS